MRPPITTHILDTHLGRPAANVAVILYRMGDSVEKIASGQTNSDGRVEQWDTDLTIVPGHYQIQFSVADYFASFNQTTFFPSVSIDFSVENTDEHYHVPLLLSGHGYSTYRGS